jgi:hypothetical protein
VSLALGLGLLVTASGWAAEPVAAKAGQLEEVVIKADEADGLSSGKPPLDVPFDPYESLRPALAPDEALLLAESPALAGWGRTRPDRLRNERLLQPWNDLLSDVSEIEFSPRADLAGALGPASAPKGLKQWAWSLSVVDEEGKPIRRFEGAGQPPEKIVWDGVSDQGERIRAGHAYSAVYKVSQSTATSRTVMGQRIHFEGLVHPAGEGRLIGLDSSALFGSNRQNKELSPKGRSLLRAAADSVRRHGFGQPLLLRALAPDSAAADTQAAKAKAYLAAELGLPPEKIVTEASVAAPSEQRLDLLVGGR